MQDDVCTVQIAIALLYHGARPVWRGLFCDDESIRYPYKSNTVSFSMLLVAFFVVVPLTVCTRTIDYTTCSIIP